MFQLFVTCGNMVYVRLFYSRSDVCVYMPFANDTLSGRICTAFADKRLKVWQLRVFPVVFPFRVKCSRSLLYLSCHVAARLIFPRVGYSEITERELR